MLFEISRSLQEVFLLRTTLTETERLTVLDVGFAMFWMATIHTEELMCVHGCRSVWMWPFSRYTHVSKNITYLADQFTVNSMVVW